MVVVCSQFLSPCNRFLQLFCAVDAVFVVVVGVCSYLLNYHGIVVCVVIVVVVVVAALLVVVVVDNATFLFFSSLSFHFFIYMFYSPWYMFITLVGSDYKFFRCLDSIQGPLKHGSRRYLQSVSADLSFP